MHFFSKEALDFKSQAENFRKLQNLVFCSLMVAIYIVISFFDIVISQSIEIRLGFLIIAIAGMLRGPIMAMSVGVLGDIIKMIVTGGKGQTFNFGITFSYAILGLAFGLVLYQSKITIARTVAACICHYLVSIFLITLSISIQSGAPFMGFFVGRFIKASIMIFINIPLLYIVTKSIQQAFKNAHVVLE